MVSIKSLMGLLSLSAPFNNLWFFMSTFASITCFCHSTTNAKKMAYLFTYVVGCTHQLWSRTKKKMWSRKFGPCIVSIIWLVISMQKFKRTLYLLYHGWFFFFKWAPSFDTLLHSHHNMLSFQQGGQVVDILLMHLCTHQLWVQWDKSLINKF